jgi:hypothetical protein
MEFSSTTASRSANEARPACTERLDWPVIIDKRSRFYKPAKVNFDASGIANCPGDALVARGASTKLLAALPDSYSANWLQRLDKRTKIARAVLSRIAELESDAGGADSLSASRRSLIRHAAWLDALVDSHELRLASGQEIDSGAYTQSLNSLIGLYRLLGLERRTRRVETLRDLMAGNE